MTPTDQTIYKLQRQVEELAGRLSDIEHGLLGASEPLMLLGLSLSEARLLAFLMKRPSVSRDAAHYFLYGGLEDDPPQTKTIDVWFSRLRKRLEPMGIKIWTKPNYGWSLSPNDKLRINGMLKDRREIAA